MNVDQKLKSHNGIGPGFHFLRHALSLTILLFHCYVLTSGGVWNTGYVKGSPLGADHLTALQMGVELLRPGLFALVGAFFALSGFLVTGSAVRSRNARVFLSLRVLRILPALATEVTLSALILGPLLTSVDLRSYFGSHLFFRYFANIVGHVSYILPGVYGEDFRTGKINGNLWTLAPEFYCYLSLLAFMVLGVLYRRATATALVTGIVAACLLATLLLGLQTRYDATHFNTWFIVMMFGMGVLFALNSDRVPVSWPLFAVSAVTYFALMYVGGFDVIAAFPLTYCTIFLGMLSYPWFDRLIKDDLSYGIYLYGYPITQVIIHEALPRIGLTSHATRLAFVAVTAIPLAVAFSAWSWRSIEKPALKLRAYVMPKRTVRPEMTEARL